MPSLKERLRRARVDKRDRRKAIRERADSYRISEVAAPPVSSEHTWYRVRRSNGRPLGTFSTRKAATDAISKDKKRST